MDEQTANVRAEERHRGEPADGSGRLSQSKFTTLALLAHSALPPDQIAATLGISLSSVRYYLSGKSEAYNAARDKITDQIVRAQVHHVHRLSSLMEDAYVAVHQALQERTGSEQERRLRAETAWKLFDRVNPPQSRQDTTVEVNQNNIHVHQEVRQSFMPVVEKFTELLQLALHQDPNKHVREGADALPSAYVDATSRVPTEVSFEEKPDA